MPRREPKYEIIVEEEEDKEEIRENVISKKERRRKKDREKERWTLENHKVAKEPREHNEVTLENAGHAINREKSLKNPLFVKSCLRV